MSPSSSLTLRLSEELQRGPIGPLDPLPVAHVDGSGRLSSTASSSAARRATSASRLACAIRAATRFTMVRKRNWSSWENSREERDPITATPRTLPPMVSGTP